MQPDAEARVSPWINWLVILGLGPIIAFFLAQLCGFEDSQRTMQIILLVEVCLVTAGVGLLILVDMIGPWTRSDLEAEEWMRLVNPEPGSMLADLASNPDGWNERLNSYLRAAWRDVSTGAVPSVVKDRATSIVASIRSSTPPAPVAAAASVPEPSIDAESHPASRRRPPARPAHRNGH